jgi:hypothetical protein
MPLSELFASLADYLHTKTFHDLARHPERPAAFTRQRKLSLPTLIAFMLGTMRMSVQAELDQFVATLTRKNTLCRQVSD